MEETADTIVACATPPGKGAIAVIRLSGKAAKKIIQTIIVSNKSKGNWPSRTLVHGFVVDSSGRPLDEVLYSFMEAPRSYTGEDVAEIYCHGGEGIVKTILEIALENGSRLANPGEFTRRAFYNRKLDITKAQGVQQLIDAGSREELYGACRVLKGELAEHIKLVQDAIKEVLIISEAAIDFPEEEDVLANTDPNIKGAYSQLTKLVGACRKGADTETQVVVAGRTNVGKSSIINRLSNKKISIVTSEPGTTRDAVETEATFGGIRVKLVDTAGKEDGLLNSEASRQAQVVADQKIDQADLVLWVGIEIKQLLEAPPPRMNRDILLISNKIDLLSTKEREKYNKDISKVDGLMVSALTGEGFEKLTETVTRKLIKRIGQADGLPIAVWQEETIRKAQESILSASDRIKSGEIELAVEDLRHGFRYTSQLLGEGIKEDLLDKIFERFCIGK